MQSQKVKHNLTPCEVNFLNEREGFEILNDIMNISIYMNLFFIGSKPLLTCQTLLND